jgi:hypothetical protein
VSSDNEDLKSVDAGEGDDGSDAEENSGNDSEKSD